MRFILSTLALLAITASSTPAAVNPTTEMPLAVFDPIIEMPLGEADPGNDISANKADPVTEMSPNEANPSTEMSMGEAELATEMSVNKADVVTLPLPSDDHSIIITGSKTESSSPGVDISGSAKKVGIGSTTGSRPFIGLNTFPNYGDLFLGFPPYNYAPLTNYFNPGIFGSPFYSAGVINRANSGILPFNSGLYSSIAGSRNEFSSPGVYSSESPNIITPTRDINRFSPFNGFNTFSNFGGFFPGSLPFNNALYSPLLNSDAITSSIPSGNSNLHDTDNDKGETTVIHFKDPATNTEGDITTKIVVNPDGSITKTTTTTTFSANGSSIRSSSSTSSVTHN